MAEDRNPENEEQEQEREQWQPPSGVAEDRNAVQAFQSDYGLTRGSHPPGWLRIATPSDSSPNAPEPEWQPPSGVAEDRNVPPGVEVRATDRVAATLRGG